MMDNHLPNNTEEIVVGLDIGTTKIACFIGQKNEFGKIELLGYGRSESVGVSRGVVANIDRTVASIKQAVAEAEQKVGAQIRLVNVGIAGQHIRSQQRNGMIARNNGETEITREDAGAGRKSLEGLLRDSEAIEPRERVQETQGKCKTSEEVSHFPEPESVVAKTKITAKRWKTPKILFHLCSMWLVQT